MDTFKDTDNVLKKINEAFGHLKMPERIVEKCDYEDKERDQIEMHFKGKDLNLLSSYDVSMLLIDGALIDPKSYLYFLPRIVKEVFQADADKHFLMERMKDLLEIDDLTRSQRDVLELLKKNLEKQRR